MAQCSEMIAKLLAYVAVSFLFALGFPSHAHSASRQQGVLDIQIKDHREAIDDFAKLNVTVQKILLSPRPGLKFWQTGWKELPVNTGAVDLTRYVGKHTARIYRGNLDAGSFEAFQLVLKISDGILKTAHRSVQIKQNVGPVKLSFEVLAQAETTLIIDLVVTDYSDHPPRGYELGLKGYELYSNGKLVDKIPPG